MKQVLTDVIRMNGGIRKGMNKNIFISQVEENDKLLIPEALCKDKGNIVFEISEDKVFLFF